MAGRDKVAGMVTSVIADAKAIMLAALVHAFGRANPRCAHDDPRRYTTVRGNLIHCACGEPFKVKCMHTRVAQMLPRVWRCEDCAEYRGGEAT